MLENNEITNGFSIIATYGPQRVTIRGNRIHQDRVPTPYKLGAQNLSGTDASTDPTAGTYQYQAAISAQMNWWFKNYSWEEGQGIDATYDGPQTKPGLHNSEISNNVIYDIPGLGISLVNSANVTIFGNDISDTADAGIVLGHTLTNIQIYDNYFHNDSINLRPGIDPQPQEMYVYRNRFDQPIFPGGKPLWFCCPPGDGSELSYNYKRYFYHNSFLGHDARGAMGMARNDFSNKDYYLNNVWSNTQVFDWDTGGFNNGIALFDYQWTGGALGTTYIAPRVPGVPIGAHTIRADGQQAWTAPAWNATAPTNFSLPVGHAARNAGLDVTSGAATALVGRGTPLPGF